MFELLELGIAGIDSTRHKNGCLWFVVIFVVVGIGYGLYFAFAPSEVAKRRTAETKRIIHPVLTSMYESDPHKDKETESFSDLLETKDAWGNQISYLRTNEDGNIWHEVRSAGVDGKFQTKDDVALYRKKSKPFKLGIDFFFGKEEPQKAKDDTRVPEEDEKGLARSVGKFFGDNAKEFGKGLLEGLFNKDEN